jgi:thiamine-phosphate pyrophosphorylase
MAINARAFAEPSAAQCFRVAPPVRAQRRPPLCTLPFPRPGTVFVTPNGICANPQRAAEIASAAVAGGIHVVQLRDREASHISLLEAAELIAVALPDPSKLVVNGPGAIIIAERVGERIGVHLRESDMETMMDHMRLRDWCSEPRLLGCSVHSVDSAIEAVSGAVGLRPSYLQVGTMFSTKSHPGKVPEGPGLLASVREAVGPDIAIIGIGGINVDNLGQLFGQSSFGGAIADGIAVISTISDAEDPSAAARLLCSKTRDAWGTKMKR